jgi:hypothetical protein
MANPGFGVLRRLMMVDCRYLEMCEQHQVYLLVSRNAKLMEKVN